MKKLIVTMVVLVGLVSGCGSVNRREDNTWTTHLEFTVAAKIEDCYAGLLEELAHRNDTATVVGIPRFLERMASINHGYGNKAWATMESILDLTESDFGYTIVKVHCDPFLTGYFSEVIRNYSNSLKK